MQKVWILLTATFLLSSMNLWAHSDHKMDPMMRKSWTLLATIQTENFQKSFELVSKNDIDIAGVDIKNKLIDVLITDHEYHTLVSLGLNPVINESKGVTKGPDQEYKNPQEIEDFMLRISQNYPDITELKSIGKSLEGRDIWAIKISDNADVKENEPAVLYNSMHHAREVMTPEVSIDIIEYLTSNYLKNKQVKQWVDSTEIWVIPMFNVDGNNKMWSVDSWWRKNTRNGYGVDLNRNYPAGWNSCNGSSGRRRSQTYRGPNPASEPETQAMMAFIQEVRPVFDISYHSYSELVIYPYGCKNKRTQTKEVVEKIGKHVAKLINYAPGTAWELLYNADGGDIDWMYEAYQVIPFVIELNGRNEGFHPKYAKWRDKTVKRNRVGWQYLLDRVQQSGVRGKVTMLNAQGDVDAYANKEIKVYKVDGGKTQLFQTYRTHQNGDYHLVLNPGNYEIRANGKQFPVSINADLSRVNIAL
jgi:carboxypeptidase T